jgi:hypothetical protein
VLRGSRHQSQATRSKLVRSDARAGISVRLHPPFSSASRGTRVGCANGTSTADANQHQHCCLHPYRWLRPRPPPPAPPAPPRATAGRAAAVTKVTIKNANFLEATIFLPLKRSNKPACSRREIGGKTKVFRLRRKLRFECLDLRNYDGIDRRWLNQTFPPPLRKLHLN